MPGGPVLGGGGVLDLVVPGGPDRGSEAAEEGARESAGGRRGGGRGECWLVPGGKGMHKREVLAGRAGL